LDPKVVPRNLLSPGAFFPAGIAPVKQNIHHFKVGLLRVQPGVDKQYYKAQVCP